MPGPPFTLPDVLVLGSGGVLGEAWMQSLLAGLERAHEDLDFRRCESYVGTSAGALVACELLAGRRPRRPEDAPRPRAPRTGAQNHRPAEPQPLESLLRSTARISGTLLRQRAGALAPSALRLGERSGALARGALLWAYPPKLGSLSEVRREIERLGLSFDGRLRVVAVQRRTGRRVVFGAPGAPPADVADAVIASCSVPWLFRPTWIGDRPYVDGGLWSSTNLDVAPAARGTVVLCLHPTGSLPAAADSPWSLARPLGRAAAQTEVLALRSLGAHVRRIVPDRASVAAIGHDLMDETRRQEVALAGYQQGLRTVARAPAR
jgi:NTE family protein